LHGSAIFLIGLALFLLLAGMVINRIDLEGSTKVVAGGIAGFGATGLLIVFRLRESKSWEARETRKGERKYGLLGFLGFVGFLGIKAFTTGRPAWLFYFCFFFMLGQFGYFRRELHHLGAFGLLGILLPTFYIVGLLVL
jgi:hypothetical protein